MKIDIIETALNAIKETDYCKEWVKTIHYPKLKDILTPKHNLFENGIKNVLIIYLELKKGYDMVDFLNYCYDMAGVLEDYGVVLSLELETKKIKKYAKNNYDSYYALDL